MNVIVYTTPTCPYCHMAMDFLKKNNIDFQEIDVSKNEAIAIDIINRSGHIGAPIIEIGEQFVAGFDEEKIKNLLYL
ncbi:glutaredoxin family protein [Patescibacteria group bacterium]|nr:glutaredoxin family protein [Patescibacteria group bacterium]